MAMQLYIRSTRITHGGSCPFFGFSLSFECAKVAGAQTLRRTYSESSDVAMSDRAPLLPRRGLGLGRQSGGAPTPGVQCGGAMKMPMQLASLLALLPLAEEAEAEREGEGWWWRSWSWRGEKDS
ncbi:hypothetical protein CLAFUW4_10638 [Fulvia fulva]|uniref:Uncharacterized protein n=1 Tax=Passalora fulva TaxID=5499 RepID=A0A9Q8LGM1_PASFU|nr:uncharacterized protein CLAFUR5_05251 [Fulvia fulva]KAK4616205.1 hypothetical protein CLAFUR4_10643 [Fulvia fulva]KAK4617380.1 hypothetical protein CLAFUR0_10601 [Fulvia fulva]UJO17037.1 hypothetical protein CLAFUR5_05251 [Fulvia fulva]WPV18903.1 hypothetical protein CLAFUW4_10638 [Fulvia fulva]WPV33965.1 hypothetical protein CLAFUW7_10640 [Fulvia fulva]